jgi:N-acetylmuramoyl-L-alanine amidase
MTINFDMNYLAATLVGEARGEPIEGIIGVANVIKNRVNKAKKTYKDICLAPKQFSCWNLEDTNFKYVSKFLSDLDNGNEIKDPYLIQCVAVAKAVFYNELLDNTKGAKNYVSLDRYKIANERKNPKLDSWILELKESIILGNHIFLI